MGRLGRWAARQAGRQADELRQAAGWLKAQRQGGVHQDSVIAQPPRKNDEWRCSFLQAPSWKISLQGISDIMRKLYTTMHSEPFFIYFSTLSKASFSHFLAKGLIL